MQLINYSCCFSYFLFPTAGGTEKTELNYCSTHGGHGFWEEVRKVQKTGPITECKSSYPVLINISHFNRSNSRSLSIYVWVYVRSYICMYVGTYVCMYVCIRSSCNMSLASQRGRGGIPLLILNLGARWGGGADCQRHDPTTLPPVPTLQEAEWALGKVWRGVEISYTVSGFETRIIQALTSRHINYAIQEPI